MNEANLKLVDGFLDSLHHLSPNTQLAYKRDLKSSVGVLR